MLSTEYRGRVPEEEEDSDLATAGADAAHTDGDSAYYRVPPDSLGLTACMRRLCNKYEVGVTGGSKQCLH